MFLDNVVTLFFCELCKAILLGLPSDMYLPDNEIGASEMIVKHS